MTINSYTHYRNNNLLVINKIRLYSADIIILLNNIYH